MKPVKFKKFSNTLTISLLLFLHVSIQSCLPKKHKNDNDQSAARPAPNAQITKTNTLNLSLTSCPADLMPALTQIQANIDSNINYTNPQNPPMGVETCPIIDLADLDPTFVSQNIYTPVATSLPVVPLDNATVASLMQSCTQMSTNSTSTSTAIPTVSSSTTTIAVGPSATSAAFSLSGPPSSPPPPPTPPTIPGKGKICPTKRCDKFSKALGSKYSSDLGVQQAADLAKELLKTDPTTKDLHAVFIDLNINIDGDAANVSILYSTGDPNDVRELTVKDLTIIRLLANALTQAKAEEAKNCTVVPLPPNGPAAPKCTQTPSRTVKSWLETILPAVGNILRSEYYKQRVISDTPLTAECAVSRCGDSSMYIADAFKRYAPEILFVGHEYAKLFKGTGWGHTVLFFPTDCVSGGGILVDKTFSQFTHLTDVFDWKNKLNKAEKDLATAQAQGAPDAQIQSLKAIVANAKTNLEKWQAKYDKFKDADMPIGRLMKSPEGRAILDLLNTKGYIEVDQTFIDKMTDALTAKPGQITDLSIVTPPTLASFGIATDTLEDCSKFENKSKTGCFTFEIEKFQIPFFPVPPNQ